MEAFQSPIAALAERTERDAILARYVATRAATLAISEPLETEDFVAQSMPDASPTKWHLAHTTWFFEQFILKPRAAAYRAFRDGFEYLFNSYYQSVGPMHRRPERGLLTRPTVEEVLRYRGHVDVEMQALLASRPDDAALVELTTLGINHEQQHQELMLTDLKHLFAQNPLLPAYHARTGNAAAEPAGPMRFVAHDGGIGEIGAMSSGFAFDNETPRHRVFTEPYALADRLVTNAEYLEFVNDGGYRRPEFWLSDGWTIVSQEGWSRPLYWSATNDAEFTLAGLQPLDPAGPVCHVSYYEADAYARWAGARLPTEAEWELAAAAAPVSGNFLEQDFLHPTRTTRAAGVSQLFGDVWEWTQSPYIPYPRYRPLSGALGEYNGKFMCNQLVLRGGSCVTPASHIRASYRNFFYPQARWQFMGLRLARDLI
jgi:ergothioneine biosynthesis protein EgtB